ncbi:hypothetical protein, partial [Pseudomonas indica]|uniref:hypothetical protein n=1 Tax=Pseudomonas indica TaxID=137658 RepID=UPI001C3EBDB2
EHIALDVVGQAGHDRTAQGAQPALGVIAVAERAADAPASIQNHVALSFYDRSSNSVDNIEFDLSTVW